MNKQTYTVLYDIDCGVCNWCRKQVEAHDPKHLFVFKNIRDSDSLKLAQNHGRYIDQQNPSSFVLITPERGWYEESIAVKIICRELLFPWKLFYYLLLITPRFIADIGYRFVARHRSFFGRMLGEKRCMME